MTTEFPLSNFVITVSLPVVLYGCESWSLTLREDRRLRVFEISPKRDEVTRRRKLRNEEHHDLYSSPKIYRLLKSRRMRLAGHVAHMGRGDAYIGFRWGNLKNRDHLGYPVVDGRMILRWIFRILDMGVWNGSSWLTIETGSGHL